MFKEVEENRVAEVTSSLHSDLYTSLFFYELVTLTFIGAILISCFLLAAR